MAFSRTTFALIWFCGIGFGAVPAVCSAASPPRPAKAEEGNTWLLRARAALAGHKTISAVIHQRVHLYEQELVATGEFVQGPPEKHLLHLDLKLKVGEQDSYCQQRCNGKFYWMQRFEDGVPMLTRIDVTRVEAARAAARHTSSGTANGKSNAEPATATMLGLGGVAHLLDQLGDWCVFPRVQQGRLPNKQALPVIVLEGSWRQERLLRWLPDQAEAASQGKPVDVRKLPPMLPDRIVVFLGRDDLFPRRVEYSVSESRRSSDGEAEPLVQLHFDNVQFDVKVDPRCFTFDGGLVPPFDDTDGYLLRNGLLGPAVPK
jgi:hypothetical protein